MKRSDSRKKMKVAILVLLVALVFPGAVLAADTLTGQNLIASALFDSEAEGIVTTAGINVSDNTITSQTTPKRKITNEFSQVFIFISQTDLATGELLLSALCSSLLEAQDFQVSPKLDSATLNVSLPCSNSAGDQVPISVDVDLTWTATPDPAATTRSKFVVKSPGFITTNTSRITSQPAQASGVIDSGLTNFIPNPSVFADIQSVTSRSVTVAQ